MKMIPEYDEVIDPADPVLDITPRMMNRWVKRAAQDLATYSGDEGWLSVTYHDLRRTWVTRLLEQGVLSSVVMSHGGWDDWSTFRKHYLGEFPPEALRRERNKVSWLGGDGVKDDSRTVSPGSSSAAGQSLE